jgi:hypothetical protein
MGTVHQLINDGGRQSALNFGVERTEVEAAITYMADEDGGIGFLYSGWCQTALPHRRLPDTDGWQIETERTTLIVEPGCGQEQPESRCQSVCRMAHEHGSSSSSFNPRPSALGRGKSSWVAACAHG